ncbi:tetratricopeptide repeat protein [Tsukamurella soli]
MTFPFDYLRTYRASLPTAADEPLLAKYESYHRFLLRATAAGAADRFASADEMREQLTGVLREVLAAEDGMPRPGSSTEFTTELASFGIDPALGTEHASAPALTTVAAALPLPKIDPDDPAAAFLATVTSPDPARVADELSHAPRSSPEVRLRMARSHIRAGDTAAARRLLDGVAALTADGDRTWPVAWYRGLAALTDGDPVGAAAHFDHVYSAVPGEAAPKLALAACAEASGDPAQATRLYRSVWRTDFAYVSAAFGLARSLSEAGDRHTAYDVLCAVPETSSHHVAARLAAAAVRADASAPDRLTEADLLAAGAEISALDGEIDPQRRALAAERVLGAALAWLRAGHTGAAAGTAEPRLLGARLTEPDLRVALEGCYRTLARHAPTSSDRITLVDKANRIRPATWM